jgi:hypothetical protein
MEMFKELSEVIFSDDIDLFPDNEDELPYTIQSARIEDLKGKKFNFIKVFKNADITDRIVFIGDNEVYVQLHIQDCCENVYIEDICGDVADITNVEIVSADKRTNVQENPDRIKRERWTFYKIDSIKGGVTIRWYGYSNGWYSEEASLMRFSW